MSRVLAPGGRLVIGEHVGCLATPAQLARIDHLAAHHFPHRPPAHQPLHGAGLQPEEIRGAVYYPPQAILAGTIAPIEVVFREHPVGGIARLPRR